MAKVTVVLDPTAMGLPELSCACTVTATQSFTFIKTGVLIQTKRVGVEVKTAVTGRVVLDVAVEPLL